MVPGSTGLMAIVGMGVNGSVGALLSVVVSVIAIALGILMGTGLFGMLSTTDRDVRPGIPASPHHRDGHPGQSVTSEIEGHEHEPGKRSDD